MTKLEEDDVVSHVRDACNKVLCRYIEKPWQWPRESDLIVDLVYFLRSFLAENATANAKFDSSLYPPVDVSRVRTEVKPRGGALRLDIGILRDTDVTVLLGSGGVRDVLLSVKLEELVAAIEVKLEPKFDWMDDILKLKKFKGDLDMRVALWVDTRLPIKSIGVPYASDTTELDSAGSRAGVRTCWPLRKRDHELRCTDGTYLKLKFLSKGPETKGLYLAALALEDDSTLVRHAVLKDGAVSSAWWLVEEGVNA